MPEQPISELRVLSDREPTRTPAECHRWKPAASVSAPMEFPLFLLMVSMVPKPWGELVG
jgi:hypothetical protein